MHDFDWEEFDEAIQRCKDIFIEFGDSVVEAAQALTRQFMGISQRFSDFFEELDKFIYYEEKSNPRKYGEALSKRKVKNNIHTYNYIYNFKRNLPYQKRRY